MKWIWSMHINAETTVTLHRMQKTAFSGSKAPATKPVRRTSGATLTGNGTASLLERRRVLLTTIQSSQPTRVSHRVIRGNTIPRQGVGLTTTGGPTHHGRRIGKALRSATENNHPSVIVQAVRTASSSPHSERYSFECGRVLYSCY